MNKLILLFIVGCLLSCASVSNNNEPVLEPVYNTRENPEIANSLSVINFGKYRISDKGASVLNQLFNTDESNASIVLIVENSSNCDFILDIKGIDVSYQLPVASNKKETVVVLKGDYELTTKICNASYLSKRKLDKNTQIKLKHTYVASVDTSAE